MKAVSSVIASLSLAMLSFGAVANSPDFPHLSTTGYGEVIATPDMAQFSVKVVESTMTAEQAKQSVLVHLERLINLRKRLLLLVRFLK